MSKPQTLFVAIAGFLVLILILIFTGILPGLQPARTKVTLKVWEVGQYSIENSLKLLKSAYPGVSYDIKKFDTMDAYENALLEGFAVGSAPDIFMVSGENFPRFSNKISAAPQTGITLVQLRSIFPQVVEQAFTLKGQIYALPLSIDNLALIYNKSLLGSAGIATPPKTWEELQQDAPQIIKKDAVGNIAIAAATLGGSAKSVTNAADILSIMMMQRGAVMVNETNTAATFADAQGNEALSYYAQFADASSSVYTWNDALPFSIDAFSQEKAAMTFGYLDDVKRIKTRSPYLNFDVAPLPQPKSLLDAGKLLTYPSLFGYAVSRQSPNYATAWGVLIALTTNPENAQAYLDETNTAPALLSLISGAQNNPQLSVFTKQALISKLWQKPNNTMVNNLFSSMIENVNTKKLRTNDALYQAQSEINKLFIRQ